MKLYEIAKEEQELLNDGIMCLVIYKKGRSWKYEELYCCEFVENEGFEWKFEEKSQCQEVLNIIEIDSNAIIINGYDSPFVQGSVKKIYEGLKYAYNSKHFLLANEKERILQKKENNNEETMFCDETHEKKFIEILNKMNSTDCYHVCVAYLIALDSVCREHINDIYDFKNQCIKTDALNKNWQTGTSKKTTRLAFNLYNGCYDDGENYVDEKGYEVPLPSRYFAVDEIFCCEYAEYYYKSLKIRYPEYFK